MTRTLLALTLALGTLCPALASAQGDDRRTDYTFTDADLVTGSIQSPDGADIHVRLRGARHTLITPRPHYIPEMLRSVETL